jgi:hypothetical protein
MNTSTAENAVQWLFLDLNAFLASCEQQENPALRDKLVIIVQTPTNTAVAIAASYARSRAPPLETAKTAPGPGGTDPKSPMEWRMG